MMPSIESRFMSRAMPPSPPKTPCRRGGVPFDEGPLSAAMGVVGRRDFFVDLVPFLAAEAEAAAESCW